MNDISSRLEFLPNETLMDMFQYLDAQDLFRAFYNLNIRFNLLLRSLDNLCLTVRKINIDNTDNLNIFSSYIYNLIINGRFIINLNNFTNIRYLTLLCVTSDHIKQLETNILPYLEHLSIGYQYFRYSYDMSNLCNKIFSNGFPYLKSCYLSEPRIIKIIPSYMQFIELHTLKIEIIDLFIYKIILSKCLNLNFFQFTIVDFYEHFTSINTHLNLKQMIIIFEDLIEPLDDNDIYPYLSCIPNLQRLSIQQTHSEIDITVYLNYDWLIRIINCYLPLLNYLKFIINFSQISVLMKCNNIHNILNCIQEEFHHIHNMKYQSKLVCSLSKLRFSD